MIGKSFLSIVENLKQSLAWWKEMVDQKKRAVSFSVYMKLQIDEILGDYNMWVTGINIRRPPTPEEAAMNYILNGGPQNFAARYTYKIPKIVLCIVCAAYQARKIFNTKFNGSLCQSFSL